MQDFSNRDLITDLNEAYKQAEDRADHPEDEPVKNLHIEFANLYMDIKEQEADLKDKKAKLAQMSQALVDEFITKEIRKISIKGGLTLRLDCKIWPKLEEGRTSADAVAAIKKAGMPELLVKENYQTQSLAAFLRECDKNDMPLPDEFNGIIKPNPVYSIIATKH